jgi:hypothetical protein
VERGLPHGGDLTADIRVPGEQLSDLAARWAVGSPCTAVIVAGGLVAQLLACALGEAGVRVPEEVALIAYDDEAAGALPPELASVRLPLAEQGRAAAAVLVAMAAGAAAPDAPILVAPELVPGRSCGCGATPPSVAPAAWRGAAAPMAAAAHEMSTPLQSVQAFLHLLEGATAEQRAGYLELIQHELGRIERIVGRLRESSLAPSGAASAAVDLNALVERVLVLNRHLIQRSGAEVRRDLDPRLPPVVGQADQLIQVLINLVANAAQAMPGGGVLTVTTGVSPAGAVVVAVGDTGPGVEPEIAGRIFEPFFTTKAGGTGLGLSICRQIVAAHDGRIEVDSAPGRGSTFRVLLPQPARAGQM